MPKFTEQDYLNGLSCRGACSKKQYLALGLEWPLRAGWYDRLIGSEKTEEQIKKFLDLKDAHLKNKQKYNEWKKAPHKSLWCGTELPDNNADFYSPDLAPWEEELETGPVDYEYYEMMKYL